jgi:hypothetical protein
MDASSTISSLTDVVNSNYASASSTISSLASVVNNNYQSASTSFATVTSLIGVNTSAIATLQAQINTVTNALNITNAPTSTLAISATGVVGIGNDATALGNEKLRVSGRVRATGFDIDTAADLAENFEAVEAVDAGTVVAFSTTTTQWKTGKASATSTDDEYAMSTVRKARAPYEAVGVISTNPGIILGNHVLNSVPVAFSGRIPVKVTTEAGVVHQGDYLTVSATIPGYAMKLTGEGQAIGRALSDYVDGQDKVLMLVENGLQKLDLAGKNATTTGMLTTGNIDLNANGVAIINIKSLASANGTWSIDENGRIVAKQLCLEDLCIDKGTLTNLLNISGQKGTVLGASTSTIQDTATTTTSTTTTTVSTTTDQGGSTTATVSTTTDPGTSSTTPVVVGSASTTTTQAADIVAPVLVLVGAQTITLTVNTPYTDEGATATDNVDGDITSKIVTTSTVNTTAVGSYTVTYKVTDAAGNTSEMTRIVNVTN